MMRRACVSGVSLRRLVVGVVLITCLSWAVGTGASAGSSPTDVTFAGATMGGTGVWDMLGTALSQIIKKEIPSIRITLVPMEGLATIPYLEQGSAELAFAGNLNLQDAMAGKGPYEGRQCKRVRAITSLYTTIPQVVALKKVPFNSLLDLQRKKYPVKVAVGSPGSGTERYSKDLLEAAGITYDDIKSWGGKVYYKDFGEAVDMMGDGLVDMIMSRGFAPQAALQEAGSTLDIKFIAIDEPIIQKIVATGLARAKIPAGTYSFQTEDYFAPATVVTLSTHLGVSEDFVYRVTKALGDHLEDVRKIHPSLKLLTRETMPQNTGAPLHPGAEKYYREIGVLK